MSRRALVRVGFVAVAAALVLTPTTALAQRGGGGRGAGGGGRIIGAPTTITGPGPIQVGPTSPQFVRGSVGARGHGHHQFGHGHRFHGNRGAFVGFAPSIWYGGYPYAYPYYYPPVVYDQAAYANAPPMYSTTMAAPRRPMQTVVEYPTGRYELRGDGYGTPYHWIWVPNPPSAPPTPAPPTFQPSPEAPPASTKPEPPGKTTVYRWTDAEGVTHFTDRLDSMPVRFRSQAKQPRS